MRPSGDRLDLVASNLGAGSYNTITSEYNGKLWSLYEAISSTPENDTAITARSAETMLESTTNSGKVLAYACYLERPDSDRSRIPGASSKKESLQRIQLFLFRLSDVF